MKLTQKTTIKISLLMTGMFITAYLLSTDKTANNKVIVNDHIVMPDHEVHNLNNERVMNENHHKKKPELALKKKEVVTPTEKLKPHHLYVRSSDEVQKEIAYRKESRKNYLQMKKTREDHMRQQRHQQHINTRKGNEDV